MDYATTLKMKQDHTFRLQHLLDEGSTFGTQNNKVDITYKGKYAVQGNRIMLMCTHEKATKDDEYAEHKAMFQAVIKPDSLSLEIVSNIKGFQFEGSKN